MLTESNPVVVSFPQALRLKIQQFDGCWLWHVAFGFQARPLRRVELQVAERLQTTTASLKKVVTDQRCLIFESCDMSERCCEENMEVDLAECCARLASLFEVDKALPRAMTTNYELFTTPLRFIQVSYCEGHCFALNLNSRNVHRLKQWFARYNLRSTLMYQVQFILYSYRTTCHRARDQCKRKHLLELK